MLAPLRSSVLRLGLVLVAVGLSASNIASQEPKPQALSLEESLKKARVDGKYAMLLRQFKAEEDHKKHGAFHEAGHRRKTRYAGQAGLPFGHWVYVYPHWYIWRDLTAAGAAKRGWGPEQMIGPPDATQGNDDSKAWASRTEDESDEWLLLEYEKPFKPASVQIHENHNPGAVHRITGFTLEGKEVELWSGKDPTAAGNAAGISGIDLKADFPLNRIKIYLDSKKVVGWNEIDAVGLIDEKRKMHWVTAAAASSTYAAEKADDAQLEKRVEELEAEVEILKETIAELQGMIKELKEAQKNK